MGRTRERCAGGGGREAAGVAYRRERLCSGAARRACQLRSFRGFGAKLAVLTYI